VQISREEFVATMAAVLFEINSEEDDRRTEKQGPKKKGFVVLPNEKWLQIWGLANNIFGLYSCLDVPFRIAFHPFSYFGSWCVPS
jgi:hypothetical protein